MRTQIIAELASNAGGDVKHAKDLISACADAGADYVKVQAYDAAWLRDDDPQKAWLIESQWSMADLAALRAKVRRR